MTSEERRIIDGLLARDNKITKDFFFTKCRPMFHNMIHNVFRDKADYYELVNDLYLYLMEKDGRRLRSFGQDDAEDKDQNTAFALIKWLKSYKVARPELDTLFETVPNAETHTVNASIVHKVTPAYGGMRSGGLLVNGNAVFCSRRRHFCGIPSQLL